MSVNVVNLSVFGWTRMICNLVEYIRLISQYIDKQSIIAVQHEILCGVQITLSSALRIIWKLCFWRKIPLFSLNFRPTSEEISRGIFSNYPISSNTTMSYIVKSSFKTIVFYDKTIVSLEQNWIHCSPHLLNYADKHNNWFLSYLWSFRYFKYGIVQMKK